MAVGDGWQYVAQVHGCEGEILIWIVAPGYQLGGVVRRIGWLPGKLGRRFAWGSLLETPPELRGDFRLLAEKLEIRLAQQAAAGRMRAGSRPGNPGGKRVERWHGRRRIGRS